MPSGNRFASQAIVARRPSTRYGHTSAGKPVGVETDEFRQRLQAAGRRFHEAGVAVVLLVHGTFVGEDPLGIYRPVSRWAPRAAAALRRGTKRTVDRWFGDAGNFTAAYARSFEREIRIDGEAPIPVRRFVWGGDNHHLARAEAAVQLVHVLDALDVAAGQRILVWAHSHGGNAVALLTNLLAADAADLDRFFAAAEVYTRGRPDKAEPWRAARDVLARRDGPRHRAALDIVTFGTPILYGWDTDGYDKLLHFVNHRAHDRLENGTTRVPDSVDEVLRGLDGDYVQQFGVAGSNFMPLPLFWRSWLADRRLGGVVAAGVKWTDYRRRLRAAQRVPQEGTTLLVDYGVADRGFLRHLAGHGVYTFESWLPFHAERVARELYPQGDVAPHEAPR